MVLKAVCGAVAGTDDEGTQAGNFLCRVVVAGRVRKLFSCRCLPGKSHTLPKHCMDLQGTASSTEEPFSHAHGLEGRTERRRACREGFSHTLNKPCGYKGTVCLQAASCNKASLMPACRECLREGGSTGRQVFRIRHSLPAHEGHVAHHRHAEWHRWSYKPPAIHGHAREEEGRVIYEDAFFREEMYGKPSEDNYHAYR